MAELTNFYDAEIRVMRISDPASKFEFSLELTRAMARGVFAHQLNQGDALALLDLDFPKTLAVGLTEEFSVRLTSNEII